MTDSKPPTVHQAWAAVMAEVSAIRKAERNANQGFSFRGIDSVVNAVGPALRKHGVYFTPRLDSVERERAAAGNKVVVDTYVIVTYTVTGPAGDSFTVTVPGEGRDWGDKGTAKAMSVAERTFLLHSLAVPTDEPDPDTTTTTTTDAPPVDPVAQSQRIIREYATIHDLDARALANEYTKAGGNPGDPAQVVRWLHWLTANTYNTQEERNDRQGGAAAQGGSRTVDDSTGQAPTAGGEGRAG